MLIDSYRFQSAVSGDPYFANVSLLLHGDGTNGSTTIIDNSPSPKTVTAIGNAQISTVQSKFNGSSILLDGAGDNLSVPDSNNFYLPADFTIECYLYAVSWAGNAGFVYFMGQYQVSDYAPILPYFSNGAPGISANAAPSGGTSIVGATSGSAIPLATWTHVAWTRLGNRWSIYVDGVERLIAASAAGTPYDSTAPFLIGRHTFPPTEYAFNGYIDEIRITKGIARYTANFTPPTASFPDS